MNNTQAVKLFNERKAIRREEASVERTLLRIERRSNLLKQKLYLARKVTEIWNGKALNVYRLPWNGGNKVMVRALWTERWGRAYRTAAKKRSWGVECGLTVQSMYDTYHGKQWRSEKEAVEAVKNWVGFKTVPLYDGGPRRRK